KHTLYKFAFVPVMLFTLQSCFVAKKYQRPVVVNEAAYRTDSLPKDSVTIAEVSWRELFTDTILARYIEEGLNNNNYIRIALQQIFAAQAYYWQGKVGYLATLSATGRVT